MKKNLLRYETAAFKKGHRVLCGVDEVGLGALAGPIVACAIAMRESEVTEAKDIRVFKRAIDDSKKLPEMVRRYLSGQIQKVAYAVGIGVVDIDEINKVNNIRTSGFTARKKAVQNLARSMGHSHLKWHELDQNIEYAERFGVHYVSITPDMILIDGPFRMQEAKHIEVKSIVGGDGKSLLIAAASIVAKVYRDNIMSHLHEVYPVYGWETNAGYGTKFHVDMLKRYGLSPVHRPNIVRRMLDGKKG